MTRLLLLREKPAPLSDIHGDSHDAYRTTIFIEVSPMRQHPVERGIRPPDPALRFKRAMLFDGVPVGLSPQRAVLMVNAPDKILIIERLVRGSADAPLALLGSCQLA